MYTYIHATTAGYLVLRPNLEKLLTALADWEATYVPGTIVAGRSMGKIFAGLTQVNLAALLDVAQTGQPTYLIGDKNSVTYIRLIKLKKEGLVAVDTFPNLIQFEYDRSNTTVYSRITEGTVLYSIQIIIPFVLFTQEQITSLFFSLKQRIPDLERELPSLAFVTQEVRVLITLQNNLKPPRTILTVSSVSEMLVWDVNEKFILYDISYAIEEEIEEMW